jgi:hypothetical protein
MKTLKIRNWMTTAALATALVAPLNAQNRIALDQVRAMAERAETAAAHAEVATQYRLHAEALEAKAAAREKEAAGYVRSMGSTARKWPGMATGKVQSAKSDAAEYRRAAAETRALADRHIRLAVEAQGVNPVQAGN